MDDKVLSFVPDESSKRSISIRQELLDLLSKSESIDISKEISNELAEVEKQLIPKAMIKQMEKTVLRFKIFLKSNNLSKEILHIRVNVWIFIWGISISLLEMLYIGQLYAPAYLICIRALLDVKTRKSESCCCNN